jgi:hypothetical protein
VKKAASAVAPLAKRFAPQIGTAIGGALGVPAGAALLGKLGSLAQQLEGEEMESEEELNAPSAVPPVDESLSESMADSATKLPRRSPNRWLGDHRYGGQPGPAFRQGGRAGSGASQRRYRETAGRNPRPAGEDHHPGPADHQQEDHLDPDRQGAQRSPSDSAHGDPGDADAGQPGAEQSAIAGQGARQQRPEARPAEPSRNRQAERFM